MEMIDRWDDMYGDRQHMCIALNEKEYCYVDSYIDNNDERQIEVIPYHRSGINVYDAKTDEPIRSLSETEYDEVYALAEEQFKVEEEMDRVWSTTNI